MKTPKTQPAYFDYAATTPIDPRVATAMADFLQSGVFGNPSSIHQFGRAAHEVLESARRDIATYLGADEPNEVIFTAGGTHANNLAIRGVVYASKIAKPHIITTPIEHKSVLEPIDEMVANDEVEVTYLPVDQYGQISVEDVKKEVRHNTVLISVMLVNNEIGTILPVREIGKYLEKYNEDRVRAGYPRIYLHTDAVQGLPYLDCRVKHLHVDLLTGSSHKYGGPKGVGFLYGKKRTPLHPLQFGGGQEFEKNPGTQNMPGIVGSAAAIRLLSDEREKNLTKVRKHKDYFIKQLSGSALESQIIANDAPHIVTAFFTGCAGSSVVINLDLAGVAVSSGSACTSGSVQPSHVLLACGYDQDMAKSAVRFSFSHLTTRKEVDQLVGELIHIVNHLSSHN